MRKAGHISVRRPVRDIRDREVYLKGKKVYEIGVPLKASLGTLEEES